MVSPDFRSASSIIEIMTIAHCSRMAVNISQLIEYCGGNQIFLNSIFRLSDSEIIVLISSSPTVDEFIASRRKIYAHDEARYPMYFNDSTFFSAKFRISQINTISTTDILTRKIFSWTDDLFDPINQVMSESDRNAVGESRDLIQQITMQNSGKAITRAMYKSEYNGKFISQQALIAAGRMISGIYIDQYRQKYEYAQCSGVPGLEYYDQEKLFPHYDYRILRHLCWLLGYGDIKRDKEKLVEDQMLHLYGSDEHRGFVGWFHVVLDCTFCHVVSESIKEGGNGRNVGQIRESIINVLSAFKERAGPPAGSFNDLKDFFIQGSATLRRIGSLGCRAGDAFARKWEENMEPVQQNKNILILTATDIEDKMLLRELQSSGFVIIEPRQLGGVISQVFAPRGGLQVFHVRSNAGSGGSAGSTLTAKDAVDELDPDFVISVGIAFGVDQSEQDMHDILISTRIWNYEPARLTGSKVTPRGEELTASSLLIAASRNVRKDGDRLHFGIIASGEKLIDSEKFIKDLLKQKSQLVGGEMEGSGISAACQRTKTDWIMMKSICDWGDKKSKEFQPESARCAAEYCVRVIKYLGTVQT